MKRQLWALACVALLFVSSAQAALTHRYSFTTNANDSIGTAHGTVVGTNGSVSGGQLVLANVNESSQNPGATGAFLDLPNQLISSTATPAGVVTVEMWLTIQAHHDWAAAFSAGTSIHGENTSDCCNDDQPYIQVIPRTGDGGQGNDVRVTSNSTGGPEGWVDDLGAANGTDLTLGQQEHLVSIFDQSGGLPGTITVYRNGALMGTAAIAANLDLKTFAPAVDNNIWVGKSQWPDSLMTGSVNELRIYNSSLSAGEALANFAAGPDAVVPEPATVALASLVLVGGLVVRRRAA